MLRSADTDEDGILNRDEFYRLPKPRNPRLLDPMEAGDMCRTGLKFI